jgi:hypothetical protein
MRSQSYHPLSRPTHVARNNGRSTELLFGATRLKEHRPKSHFVEHLVRQLPDAPEPPHLLFGGMAFLNLAERPRAGAAEDSESVYVPQRKIYDDSTTPSV